MSRHHPYAFTKTELELKLPFTYVLSSLRYFLAREMAPPHNMSMFPTAAEQRRHFCIKKESETTRSTSSRNARGNGVLRSRATATREAMQYLRNQAHLCVSAQQGRVSSSRSQARATSTCSHQKTTTWALRKAANVPLLQRQRRLRSRVLRDIVQKLRPPLMDYSYPAPSNTRGPRPTSQTHKCYHCHLSQHPAKHTDPYST